MNNKIKIKNILDLAIKYHQDNNFKKATHYYKQILKIDENHFESNFRLGTLFIQIENFKEAQLLLSRAVKINFNHVHANNNLGIAFYELGELNEAIKCYEEVLKINPSYVESIFRLGTLLAQKGDFVKASRMLEKFIDINPGNSDAYHNLGLIYKEQGDFKKAIICFGKAIEINPKNTDVFYNLGVMYKEQGDFKKAIMHYVKVIELNPNHTAAINNLSILFKGIQFNNLNKTNSDFLRKIFLFLFRRNDIEHNAIFTNAKLIVLAEYELDSLEKLFNLEFLLKEKIFIKLMKDELFLLILRKSIIKDNLFEKILTKLRLEILITLFKSDKKILKEHYEFIISLSQQCFLNEYVFYQSDKESIYINKLKNLIEIDNSIKELEIVILSCFTPLNYSQIVVNKVSNYESKNVLFNNLITLQIKEPLREKKLLNSIKSIGEISDYVSQKVRSQYEENPYPRWRYTNNQLPANPIVIINSQIKPNKIKFNNNFNKPNVLIAGCGTGKHIYIAENYLNSNITAVDLSKASLAYAKRKIIESGINNVEFIHADILELSKLNRKFDIIESVGVIHHMQDPLVGLDILLNLLEPHGFLKLGLYSEIARSDVIEARKFIQYNKFGSTIKDIRGVRQFIIDEKENKLLQNICQNGDFFSISTVRDLIFHVQEHRFTLSQLSKILSDFNLQFLGFIDLELKNKYSELYPDDKNNISLKNWNQFETKYPHTFNNMYKFWLKKINNS